MREILGVLVPFFAIAAIGYAAARFKLIFQSGLNGLNAYLFNFALPVMLFRGVATRNLSELADVRLAFVYGTAAILLFFATTAIAARYFRLERPTAIFHGLCISSRAATCATSACSRRRSCPRPLSAWRP